MIPWLRTKDKHPWRFIEKWSLYIIRDGHHSPFLLRPSSLRKPGQGLACCFKEQTEMKHTHKRRSWSHSTAMLRSIDGGFLSIISGLEPEWTSSSQRLLAQPQLSYDFLIREVATFKVQGEGFFFISSWRSGIAWSCEKNHREGKP